MPKNYRHYTKEEAQRLHDEMQRQETAAQLSALFFGLAIALVFAAIA